MSADWETRRQPANDRSRNKADHHREPWTTDEYDFIRKEWVEVEAADRDEETIAEILGRTVEACRIAAHYVRTGTIPNSRPRRVTTTTETTTTRTTTTTTDDYIGAHDDPEDVWWR